MLNSAKHEMFPLISVKMPIIVGILTFMNRKNSILGLSEPKNVGILDIFILISQLSEHEKSFLTSEPR